MRKYSVRVRITACMAGTIAIIAMVLLVVHGNQAPSDQIAVEALLNNLSSSDASQRLAAARELRRKGPAARAALVGLRKALSDEDHAVRCMAALALWRINREAVPLLTILGKELWESWYCVNCDHSDSCLGAAMLEIKSAFLCAPGLDVRTKGELEPSHSWDEVKAAVFAIASALREQNVAARRAAAFVLATEIVDSVSVERSKKAILLKAEFTFNVSIAGPLEGQVAVPALIEAVGDEDLAVSRLSIIALARLGPHAHQAVPTIRAAVGKYTALEAGAVILLGGSWPHAMLDFWFQSWLVLELDVTRRTAEDAVFSIEAKE